MYLHGYDSFFYAAEESINDFSFFGDEADAPRARRRGFYEAVKYFSPPAARIGRPRTVVANEYGSRTAVGIRRGTLNTNFEFRSIIGRRS